MATYSAQVSRLVTRRTFDMIFTPELNNTPTPYNGSVSDRTYPMRAMTIYSGAQPTAQTVESNWTAYKSSNTNCLAHYNNMVSFLYNASTKTYYFTNTLSTITTNALRSGTASWAIIWMATTVDVSLNAIPASSKFVVVPVSDTTGVGAIRYTDTTATLGQPFVPYDGGVTLTEV
jgi:hypothetical protein